MPIYNELNRPALAAIIFIQRDILLKIVFIHNENILKKISETSFMMIKFQSMCFLIPAIVFVRFQDNNMSLLKQCTSFKSLVKWSIEC